MVSLLYAIIALLSPVKYRGIVNPGTSGSCFQDIMHPANGKSLLVIQISKVEGQTVDLEIQSKNGLSPSPFYDEKFVYKNLTTSKDVYIGLDNEVEGYFTPCLTVKPEKGQSPKELYVSVRIITEQNEVNQIINSIFDAGIK